jgi:hypothetical protein
VGAADEDGELATLGQVRWHTTKLLEPIGIAAPIEFEQSWYQIHPSNRPRGAAKTEVVAERMNRYGVGSSSGT